MKKKHAFCLVSAIAVLVLFYNASAEEDLLIGKWEANWYAMTSGSSLTHSAAMNNSVYSTLTISPGEHGTIVVEYTWRGTRNSPDGSVTQTVTVKDRKFGWQSKISGRYFQFELKDDGKIRGLINNGEYLAEFRKIRK